jgi:DNA polymerase-3 subunit beta
MKIVCLGLDFSDAVIKVSKAISTKKNIPILECIKIQAYGSTVKLSATDLELSIEKIIKAEVMIEGEIVVPAKTFAEFVRKVSANELELSSVEGNRLLVTYNENQCYFQCMDVSEYPKINEIEESSSFVIDVKEFKKVIDKTIFAVATEEMRPIFKGCFFELKDKKLTVVALDGYRMSVYHTDKITYENDFSIIIPARSLIEISKLLENDDEKVKIIISDNKMMLNLTHTIIISRLIQGDFIQYSNILPTDFTLTVTVKTSDFRDAMDRVSLISRMDKNNTVKFILNDNIMTINSRSDEVGNVEEKLPVTMKGKEVDICFNSKYITDCLNYIDEEYLNINIKNSGSACTIVPVENENYINLILPIRVNS